MKNDDTVLIQRTLAGDNDAFSELVRKYQKQVHALAWRKIGDFHIAEDITQDTFLKAYQRLHTLKEPQRFAGWLYVIASRRCLGWFREKRRSHKTLENIDTPINDIDTYSKHIVEQKTKSTEIAQQEVVKKLLETLKESDRTVITLHYFGEMTCEEIGEFLGVSANTIKSRLRRARNRLKQEEPMIREAIKNFNISPNLTNNIMQEISQLKPIAPASSRPFIPWVIGAASVVMIAMILGIGGQYLAQFQTPYSLDAPSETTVELVEAKFLRDFIEKQDGQLQNGVLSNKNGENNGDGKQVNQVSTGQGDYKHWNLPEGAKTRLGKGSINGIAFSPDGKQIAVGSSTGAWLYDAVNGDELDLLTNHTTAVGPVAYSPDGKTLAAGTHNNKVLLWDVFTGKLLKSYNKEDGLIELLKFSADGKELICKYYMTVRIWNINTGEKRDFHPSSSRGLSALYREIIGHEVSNLALHQKSDDDDGILAVGYADGKIALENATTNKHIKTLRGHKEYIMQLVFSPDGRYLVSESSNDSVKLWDVTTGKSIKTLTEKPTSWGILKFAQDGKTLVFQTRNGVIEVWDVNTQTLRTKLNRQLDKRINFSAFSPNSKTFATANPNGKVKIWDLYTGDELVSFSTGHLQGLRDLVFSPDNNTLANGYYGEVHLWNTQNLNKKLIPINTELMGMIFSENNNTLTIAQRFKFIFERRDRFIKETILGTLSVWDTTTNNNVSDFTVDWYKGEFPIPKGKIKNSFSSSGLDSGQPGNVVFSQDGFRLATAINTNDATKDNRFTIVLWEIWENPKRRTYIELKGHTDTINALVFNHKSTVLASGSKDGTIRLWDVGTGKHILNIPSENTNALTFSMDDKLIANISNNTHINIWEINSKRKLFTLQAENRLTDVLAFSTDDKILACADKFGAIQLWDIATANNLSTYKGHSDWMTALTFSPDGKTLVSGSMDGTVFLWDLPSN